MKKLIIPIIAIIAASAFVFATPKHKYSDPCPDSYKRWFKIKLDCNNQFDFLQLINSWNYSVITPQQLLDTCSGSQCICAIFACSRNDVPTLPNIASSTTIYQDLWAWYRIHGTSGQLAFKDDVIQGDGIKR